MVVKKLTDQSSDEDLFRQAVGEVVPLKSPPRTDSKAPRPSRPRHQREPVSTARQYIHQDDNDPTHINAEDGSSHRKNGVQKRILQKLKRGQFPVVEQLDLHSMSTLTGHAALLEFIEGIPNRTLECVRIIHGKGLRSADGPRLKLMARKLLREHPRVLAFTDCKPADGGSGAVDVLLRSS
jgi:DNA-nicking Smr family endonuclease